MKEALSPVKKVQKQSQVWGQRHFAWEGPHSLECLSNREIYSQGHLFVRGCSSGEREGDSRRGCFQPRSIAQNLLILLDFSLLKAQPSVFLIPVNARLWLQVISEEYVPEYCWRFSFESPRSSIDADFLLVPASVPTRGTTSIGAFSSSITSFRLPHSWLRNRAYSISLQGACHLGNMCCGAGEWREHVNEGSRGSSLGHRTGSRLLGNVVTAKWVSFSH